MLEENKLIWFTQFKGNLKLTLAYSLEKDLNFKYSQFIGSNSVNNQSSYLHQIAEFIAAQAST